PPSHTPHPSPTRRSSDPHLQHPAANGGPELAGAPHSVRTSPRRGSQDARTAVEQVGTGVGRTPPLRTRDRVGTDEDRPGGRVTLDRKSTRLNSSHLGISY